MRATLWIAVSGFLLTSGSAYAGTGLHIGHDDSVHADDLAKASPARFDVTITDQGPQSSAQDLSEKQPPEASPQEKAGPSSYPVTVDPQHPGGLFPWGG